MAADFVQDINNDTVDTGVLNPMKNGSTSPIIGKQDMSDYSFGMNPDQEAAYNQQFAQNNMSAPTGALPNHAYYPTLGGNVNVGNYSGSQIGSTTLFAPDAGVVPLGMLDARDLAVHHAALKKAADVDQFMKSFKAPTSKLVNINDHLRDEYFNHLDKSWKGALKATGGDANKAAYMLKTNPQFAAKTKSYQDLAKYGDAIVNKTAQDDEDIKTGRFTPTPSYNELKKQMYTALDPTHPSFQQLGNIYNKMHVERDFSDAFNDITKKMVADQTGYAYDNLNNPEFAKVYEGTVKSWTPEQKDAVAKTLSENIYHGNDYFTPEKIKKDVYGLLSGKEVKKDMSLIQKSDASKDDVDYANAPPVSSKVFNTATPIKSQVQATDEKGAPLFKDGKPVMKDVVTKGLTNIFAENGYKTSAADEQKKISISLSKETVDTQGKGLNLKAGQVSGTVAGAFNAYFDKQHNRFLNEKEVEDLKAGKNRNSNSIVMKPAVMFTPEQTKEEAAKGTPSNGIPISIEEVKGKFPNKGDKKGFDHVLEKLKTESESENAKRHGTGWPVSQQSPSAKVTTTPSGKKKIAGF